MCMDYCVKMCFLTVGLSLRSLKHIDLRLSPILDSLCCTPAASLSALPHLLYLTCSCFHAVFPLRGCPLHLHSTLAGSPHSHCSASGGSKTRFSFFLFFFKIMYLSCVAQEKSVKSIMQHLVMLI